VKEQFEVWRYTFPTKGEHPVVIISNTDLCAQSIVNVLYCTSQRQNRAPKPFEVLLNGSDGMDWETFCDCSVLWAVPVDGLFGRRGRVTLERRREIRAKIRDVFRLIATD
jgi:mRNA-degrading endonuclease toxin of MazEF toxin-antitoxin module